MNYWTQQVSRWCAGWLQTELKNQISSVLVLSSLWPQVGQDFSHHRKPSRSFITSRRFPSWLDARNKCSCFIYFDAKKTVSSSLVSPFCIVVFLKTVKTQEVRSPLFFLSTLKYSSKGPTKIYDRRTEQNFLMTTEREKKVRRLFHWSQWVTL